MASRNFGKIRSDRRLGLGLRRTLRACLRLQQLRRLADKPGGSPPAGDFQDTFLARLHYVFVAYSDNRINFHVRSPNCPGPRDTSSCRDRSVEIFSPCWLVYCALTGKTREIHFAALANASEFVSATEHSKSARHPDVARLKTQSLAEPLRVDTGVVREQLDQLATCRLGCRANRPPARRR